MLYPFPRSGLYAITHTEGRTSAQILAQVELALQGGATVLQYRDKAPADAEALARQLLALCHRYRVPLIINDHVELAQTIGADGVHLGRDDGDWRKARAVLGERAIIGVSCYNDVQRALAAQQVGVDYVAFGRFYPSDSKPLAAPAELDSLRRAKQCIQIPLVAIGGILPGNGAALLDAGADLLAVIGGLFQAPDIAAAARAYRTLF
jgi:thiamine-phosphate pyrophosphorylase